MITLRGSAVPRITKCPASAEAPSSPINWVSEYSRLGTATHRAFASVIRGDTSDLEEIAAEEEVELPDLKRSFGFLMRAWDKTRTWFPAPIVENPLRWVDTSNGITLTGQPDIVSLVGTDEARVGDWKTGFLDGDYEGQLKAYALLVAKTHNCQTITGVQINTRLRGGEVWRWERDELETWWEELADSLVPEAVPSPGTHCKFCPRWAECAAGRRYVRLAAESLVEVAGLHGKGDNTDLLSHDTLIALAEQRKLVSDACELVQTLLRREVASRGGSVVHSDGKRSLELQETKTTQIDYATGKLVLISELGPRFNEVVEVGKTKVETLVKERTTRGQKGKAVAEVMEKLDAAGALHTVSGEKLILGKPSAKEENS